ncbi:MAG: diguanylate cyclase [Hydrogenophaga sp.]|nr:diguanylate cyclase [Hydrogenophaga sp.]
MNLEAARPVTDLDQLPCPVVLTSASGRVLRVNAELARVAGGDAGRWVGLQIDALMPPASRIFLQTHVWPMLYREGSVREIHLLLLGEAGQRLPVMVNCDRREGADGPTYLWVLFVANQRSQFEAELLAARQRADQAAVALRESERFLRTITDAVPGLVAYWDKTLCCRFANNGHADWYRRPVPELLGQHMADIVGPHLFEQKKPHVQAALAGEQRSFETMVQGPDGQQRHHLNHYIPDTAADGSVHGFYVLAVNITELKEAQAELQLAHSAVSSTAEGIVVTDAKGMVLSVNPAITAITGYEAGELLGQPLKNLRRDPNDAASQALLEQALGTTGAHRGEVWVRRKDGEPFPAWRTVTRIPAGFGVAERRVVVIHDISERQRDDERLRHLAFHDPLTDLPNRALLLDRLNQLLVRTEREGRTLAVLYLDLDGFKSVNDSLGHGAGDALLRESARRLLHLVRRSDTVARLGGDEFVILIDNPSHANEVELVAQRVIAALSAPFELAQASARISTSVGITLASGQVVDGEGLLHRADQALYAAKQAGRNTYRFVKDEAALPGGDTACGR